MSIPSSARALASRRGERTLDSLSWRAAEAMQRVGDAARRSTPRWRARPQVDALRTAFERGGYEMARALADDVVPRLRDLAPARRREALPLVLETLLAHGERAEALAIARDHRSDLEATARGVGLLSVLGDAGALRRFVLPGGGLNAFAIAAAVEAGRLGGDDVLDLLLRHRPALLRRPDLHLLVHAAFRASDPARARAALDRFLRAHSLPRCRTVPGGDLLRSIRFAAAPARRRGPLVSVLVPAYRAAGTIEYAVDSLLGQTWRDLEVLVCDDESDDGTVELLRRRYGAEPRVRLFASARNQGSYNVRNALLERARGEIATFHDADDLALPTRIETQVARLRRPGVVACYACFVRVTDDGRFVFFRDQSATRLCRVTLMARRSVLGSNPFRPVRYGGDLELHEALRHRHGDRHVTVVRRPLLFGLWSDTSATRLPGSESHADGYRSPARRAYAQRIFERFVLGRSPDFSATLRETGNEATPSEIVEFASGGK